MWFINGLIKLSPGNMLFPLAFMAILFDETLDIEHLTPWPVLFAALFGTIGINMIFGGRRKKNVEINGKKYQWDGRKNIVEESSQSDETFDCEVAFGASVKYVNSQNLRAARIETSFGNSTIYFDHARLMNAQATVNVETSFGKTTLYVPKEWNVSVNVSKAFGGATEQGKCTPNGENTLIIMGEVSFGSLEVIYI